MRIDAVASGGVDTAASLNGVVMPALCQRESLHRVSHELLDARRLAIVGLLEKYSESAIGQLFELLELGRRVARGRGWRTSPTAPRRSGGSRARSARGARRPSVGPPPPRIDQLAFALQPVAELVVGGVSNPSASRLASSGRAGESRASASADACASRGCSSAGSGGAAARGPHAFGSGSSALLPREAFALACPANARSQSPGHGEPLHRCPSRGRLDSSGWIRTTGLTIITHAPPYERRARAGTGCGENPCKATVL
jgi:hypothetical protein